MMGVPSEHSFWASSIERGRSSNEARESQLNTANTPLAPR